MSSATVHPEARAALRARLATCPDMLAEGRRAYEGFAFDPAPTAGQKPKAFIEDKLAVTGDVPVAHGAIEHRMSYILTLKFPSNEGTVAIETLAGKLLDHFKVGTKLTYGSTTVLCYGAERRGAIVQEVDWQVLTVAVDLQTFTLE